MEYVDILTMVLDSDLYTTKEYTELQENVPTQYFEDTSRLSDTAIMHKIDNGRYMSLYRDDDVIYLDYFFGGKGSFKSCTKKVKLEFSTHVREELEYLDPITLTTADEDLDQYIWCMEATVFDLTRDNIDLNQVIEKERYGVSYHLRKTKETHFFLESKIWIPRTKKLTSEYSISENSLFFDIAPTFQRLIKGAENMTEAERIAEIKEMKEFFGIGDDDNKDYQDDYEDEDYQDLNDYKYDNSDEFDL